MTIRVTAACAVVALLVAACGDGGAATTVTTSPPPTSASTAVTTTTSLVTTTTTTTTTLPEPVVQWTAWTPADPGDNPAPPRCGGCSGGVAPVDRDRGILFVDAAGVVWAPGRDALTVWDPATGETTTFDRGDGLADGTVFTVARAPSGDLWVATYAGANRWDGARFVHGLTDDDGLLGETTWNLWVQSDGTVWVATNQGYVLSAFDGTNLRHFSDADSASWMGEGIAAVFPPFTQLTDMAEAPDGTLWFGSNGNGLFSFDGEEWQRFTEDDGLVSGSVEAVAIDGDGTLWLDVIGGLTRFDGTTFEVIDPEVMGAWQGEYPDDVAIGPDGALWVVAASVVFRYLDGEWESWDSADGLAFRELRTLTIGEDGSVWVADLDGVARFGEVLFGG